MVAVMVGVHDERQGFRRDTLGGEPVLHRVGVAAEARIDQHWPASMQQDRVGAREGALEEGDGEAHRRQRAANRAKERARVS